MVTELPDTQQFPWGISLPAQCVCVCVCKRSKLLLDIIKTHIKDNLERREGVGVKGGGGTRGCCQEKEVFVLSKLAARSDYVLYWLFIATIFMGSFNNTNDLFYISLIVFILELWSSNVKLTVLNADEKAQ